MPTLPPIHHPRRISSPCLPQETGVTRDVLGPVFSLSRFSGRGWPRLCEAGRGCNAPAKPATSAILLILTLLLSLAPATTTHAQTPTPADVLTAFRTTDTYIRNWSVPQAPISKDADPKLNPRAVGVCITLKLRGEIIARGTSWSATIAGPDAPDPDLIRQAALAAIQQAEPKLGVPNDAFRDEAIKQVVKDIAISLELAGPLSAVEFDTWDQAELALRPGLDGVAARVQTGALSATFPSQMMLSNTLPHRALGGAASKALGEGGAAAALDEPKKLREQSGVRMYRFRVQHAVQAESDGAAHLLMRGGRVVDVSAAATRAQLRAMADGLAQHLQKVLDAKAARSEVDRYYHRNSKLPIMQADTPSLAFASKALRDYAILEGPSRAEVHVAMSAAIGLAKVVMVRASSGTPEGATLATLVTQIVNDRPCGFFDCESCKPGSNLPCYERFGKSLEINRATWDARGQPASLRPLIAMVYPEAFDFLRFAPLDDEKGLGECERARLRLRAPIEAMLADTPEAALVGCMPWLGWAEIRAGAAIAQSCQTPNEVPSALLLRRMRDQVWQHQLSATDVNEDTLDMAGGIVFTSGLEAGKGGGGGGGNPYPTWQCVRPLAFIATMLGDPRLTEPAERPREIARLMQAMRHLRQLQVDDAASWMYPDPSLAKGGIRAAVWDNSLPIDATSLTLLTVVELLKSLDELAKPAATAPAPIPAKDVADEPRTK